jgi:hypothetical protein
LTDSRRNNQAQRQQWVDGRPSSYIERKSAAVGGFPTFAAQLSDDEVASLAVILRSREQPASSINRRRPRGQAAGIPDVVLVCLPS